MVVVGSKVQVFHGNADRTPGGLVKDDLMKNKHGKIVSKKQHEAGMRTGKANLAKSGYLIPTKRKSAGKHAR